MHEWLRCSDAAANHQLPIAGAFGIIWIVCGGIFNLMQNLIQIHCSTHCLIEWHSTLAHSKASTTPLTSTVKSSLFTRTHSSPLSLAVRLHWHCTNHSHYIKNGWNFSRQTSIYIHTLINILLKVHIYLNGFLIFCNSDVSLGHYKLIDILDASFLLLCIIL